MMCSAPELVDIVRCEAMSLLLRAPVPRPSAGGSQDFLAPISPFAPAGIPVIHGRCRAYASVM
jgi:hypothetical protein